jgi:glutamyl-tRNA reductase
MHIVVVGLNHQTASLDLREKLTTAPAALPVALQSLVNNHRLSESLILSTCNRIEVYGVAPKPEEGFQAIEQFLCKRHEPLAVHLDRVLYRFAEPESIRHLFRVASGLDSMVVGEPEIFGQIKDAYETARQARATGKMLNQLFQKTFQVAKFVRSSTDIGKGNLSVATVAIELAEKIFGSLRNRRVMIIGAGEMSEKTGRSLLDRGVHSVIVSNRNFERAAELAKQLHALAIHFDDWEREFAGIDIVISSTAAPHFILTKEKLIPLMKLRRQRPLFLIDIALPRDIEPSVNELDNVYLYNIDDLRVVAEENRKTRELQVGHCEEIIRGKVEQVHSWLRRQPNGGVASGPK